MTKILVTGGCGFIGQSVVNRLYRAGHDITVVDRNTSRGVSVPVPVIQDDFYDFVNTTDEKFDTIVHLAASHEVELSTKYPRQFYNNNVAKTIGLLDLMSQGLIADHIVFSSSGAVYGNTYTGILNEADPYQHTNSYASTKIAGELAILDYARAYNIGYTIFRYFNAAGADPKGNYGYVQRPATHAVPILCNCAINEKRFTIFGNDYKTSDSTCVRDYVHIEDIASAHVASIDHYWQTKNSEVFNIGTGLGVSMLELVNIAEKAYGKPIDYAIGQRRPGDPARLVSDTDKIRSVLGWRPAYFIDDIINHSLNWQKKWNSISPS